MYPVLELLAGETPPGRGAFCLVSFLKEEDCVGGRIVHSSKGTIGIKRRRAF